jgi:CBS domain-containing protein
MMVRHRINRLPVLEEGKLVGILTRGDIISGLGMGGRKLKRIEGGICAVGGVRASGGKRASTA